MSGPPEDVSVLPVPRRRQGSSELGVAIREASAQSGLSQEALAVDADLDRSYVGGIERGEHNLTVMNLRKISDALNMKMSALLMDANM